MGRREWIKHVIVAVIEMPFKLGLDAYIIMMIGFIAMVVLANLISGNFAKRKFEWINLLLFCSIGLLLSVILKVFNFDLSKEYLEVLICLIINVTIFTVFKYIKNKMLGGV